VVPALLFRGLLRVGCAVREIAEIGITIEYRQSAVWSLWYLELILRVSEAQVAGSKLVSVPMQPCAEVVTVR
jgi:hypothetical protein